MTSNKIGVNLRVSGNSSQGGRRYMEDTHATRFIRQDGKDYEFAYFGIFDGHGGPEASRFARDNLLEEITKYDAFWSEDDDDIMWAIHSGFLDTHQAMWREVDKWPKTWSGLPSTAGTTASVAIIKNSKLYIGHVGDSGIVLGCQIGTPESRCMEARCLTRDHKPDSPEEKTRIERSGGAVVAKSGVQRVVWSRPKVHHKGPIRRSTQIDKIPFLAVARSLGDLWSYDYLSEKFVVSPEPDVSVHKLDARTDRCLILASDGLWNMLRPEETIGVVAELETHFEERVISDPTVPLCYWVNPAERLVTRALNKWRARMMKADNTSAIVVLIDPLGPSKLSLLKKKREERRKSGVSSCGSDKKEQGYKNPLISSLHGNHNMTTVLPQTPQRSAKVNQNTPKSAPGKLFSNPLGDRGAHLKEKEKKSNVSRLQSNLDDSVQLLSALKTLPTSGGETRLSSGQSKADEFTVLKDTKSSVQKMVPWSAASDNAVTEDAADGSIENVRTRSKSRAAAPAHRVLCQQTAKGNCKDAIQDNSFGGIFRPSKLSNLEHVLQNQVDNNALPKKGKIKKKHQNYMVPLKTELNKNNSNSCSKTGRKQKLLQKTLRKAKIAAKKSMCLENSLFLGRRALRNQNSGKRKMDMSSATPAAKRCRHSEPVH